MSETIEDPFESPLDQPSEPQGRLRWNLSRILLLIGLIVIAVAGVVLLVRHFNENSNSSDAAARASDVAWANGPLVRAYVIHLNHAELRLSTAINRTKVPWSMLTGEINADCAALRHALETAAPADPPAPPLRRDWVALLVDTRTVASCSGLHVMHEVTWKAHLAALSGAGYDDTQRLQKDFEALSKGS